MQEARAGKMSDVILEAKVFCSKITLKLWTGEFGVNA